MKKRRVLNRILGSRGSSLVMALVTITILMLLGLAAITLSTGTLTSNAADAATNDAFYAAEAGVNSALDQLKLEVSRYYTAMKAASGTDYTNLYNNFAANIASYAQSRFSEPSVTGGSTQTTFTVQSFDPQTNVCVLLATTTSTMADGTKYQVQGRLNVKRVDVSSKSWFSDLGALVVGGTLTVNSSSGITVNNGNAVLGALVHQVPWDYTVNNGQTTINPSVSSLINDSLTYPSFSDPVISNPVYYITENKTMTSTNYPWTTPVSVDTAENVNLTITNSNVIPAGILRSRGDLTFGSGGNVNCDIYCRNLIADGRAIYGNLYVRGNMSKTGGDIYGNVYCDGNVTLSNISIHGSIISGGNVTIQGATAIGNIFANGTISLSNLGASGNVIYSKSKIVTSGTTISAILFSGNEISLNSGTGTITGAVISKGSCGVSSWPTINYSASDIATKLANIKGTFFDSSGGSTSLDSSSVFQGQSITANGRVN